MDARQSVRTVKANGETVTRLRLEKGWRVEDLAKQAQCSLKTVENVERGANVYMYTLKRIAMALAVDYQSLLHEAPTAMTSVPQTNRRIEVQIQLSIPCEELDESAQLFDLVKALTAILSARNEIGVLDVRNGSTIITLEIDAQDWDALFAAFAEGRLEELGITAIRTVDHTKGVFHWWWDYATASYYHGLNLARDDDL